MEETDNIDDLLRNSVFLDINGNEIENPFLSSTPSETVSDVSSFQPEQVAESFFDVELPPVISTIEDIPIPKEEPDHNPEINKADIKNGLVKTFINKYGEERVDVIDGDIRTKIIVHYPIINITNSTGRKHIITDFYTKFEFVHTNNKVSLDNLSGIRGSFTKDEWLSGYGFSHLGGAVESWGNFCMGWGTPMDSIRTKLYDYDNIYVVYKSELDVFLDDLLIFLLMYDSYLEWESISGVPYKHLNSIGTFSRFTSLSTSRFNISASSYTFGKGILSILLDSKNLIEELFDKCIINSGDGIKINVFQLSLLIDSLFNDDKKNTNAIKFIEYDPFTYVCKKETAPIEEYIYRDGTLKRGTEFSFKGKKIIQRLTDVKLNEEGKPEDKSLIIDPEIIASVAIVLLNMLNNIDKIYEY